MDRIRLSGKFVYLTRHARAAVAPGWRTRKLAATILAIMISLLSTLVISAPQKSLNIGVYQNPPKLFLDDKGKLSGIFGDLFNEIASREDWTITPVPCEWDQCLNLLETGAIDIMPDVAHSEFRARTLDFHDTPALHSWSQIYQRARGGIRAIPDLDGKRVAVLTGSVQERYLTQLADNFGVTVTWMSVSNYAAGFALLANGEVDAAVSNHHYGDRQAITMGIEATPIIFQPARLFYTGSGGRHLNELAAIEAYLIRWQADPDSPYHEILHRWSQRNSLLAIPPYMIGLLLLLALGLVIALIFNLLLRHRVDLHTRDLKTSKQRLNTILDSVQAHIYIKDEELRYQYANQRLCGLLGKTPTEVLGKTDRELFESETAERRHYSDRLVLERGARSANEELSELCDEGTQRTFISVKIPLRDADDRVYGLCGIDTEITEYRNIQKAIHQLAFYDPLTDLPNRGLFLDRVRHALANQEQTGFEGALLFIDLDNFKNLNDSLGHEKGDQLLKLIADRLREGMRPTDSLARLGGDEFVLLVEGLHQQLNEAADQAKILAQVTMDRISVPLQIGRTSHVATASIGIVMFCDGLNNPEELLKRAELAMYEAKQRGRNNLQFFNPIMQAEASRRASIEADLRKAIELDQLQLHVQPQVDHTGRILGMEALLRWTHPDEGLIPPGSFIPIAESSGLIISLGEWVLREACTLLDEWAQSPETADRTLAVNISPKQFRHPGFVQTVLTLLDESHFDPRRLELELTESLLVEDVQDTAERMRILGERGVRFSLDDFGTGYASLGYLKRLPLFQLKIDQSFVRDVLTDPNDMAIVSTIVALGNSLDLRVIAEGVETEAQRDRLLQLGCLFYQGYYFGRPAPAVRRVASA
ncbi:EAL domain-containing protein [Halopseudomonas salina]|uniref:Periplasmic sensor diguanylate cyclase/phosphodiesterase n=1 Tax=Halopseudomonas salina TaxID=1323744 RepID=A0ABQ1PRK7_9GAMM|nr:EAL domain-containing protein [Halopseudomonas salina]GGD01879.1 hypothetical protein GCM10007418_21410 [Halopseudomonas salina]